MARTAKDGQDVALEVQRAPKMLKDFRRMPGEASKHRWREKALSPDNIRKIERRYKVLELRKLGYSIRQIADTIGANVATVQSDLKEVLRIAVSTMEENTEEARHLEIERLDEIMKAYYEVATGPLVDENGNIVPENMNAAALVLKVIDQRCKLLALSKPESKSESKTGIREYVGINLDQV
jgi:uncharacterized protein YerC